MPVTLGMVRVNTTDDLKATIIDEFVKNNYLLRNIPFDDVISPLGGGSTLTYGYHRKESEGGAEFRAVNEEYNEFYATKTRHVTDLKIFGGAGSIDRVINSLGGIVRELDFQMKDRIKAAAGLFNDTVINGDSAQNAKQFDGLDVMLTGTKMEFEPPTGSGKTSTGDAVDYIDISNTEMTNKNYQVLGDLLDEFISNFDSKPSCLMGNTKMIMAISRCAKRFGEDLQTQDEWGNYIYHYNGIPLIDLGDKPGVAFGDVRQPTSYIVQNKDKSFGGTTVSGISSLYGVRFGLDGFHAIGMAPGHGQSAGEGLIRYFLPNFNDPGAVKRYEVEMISAVILKNTRAAGVFRNIKVA